MITKAEFEKLMYEYAAIHQELGQGIDDLTGKSIRRLQEKSKAQEDLIWRVIQANSSYKSDVTSSPDTTGECIVCDQPSVVLKQFRDNCPQYYCGRHKHRTDFMGITT